MFAQPLVTTVIPTYQRPHLLRRAIRSVLDQTYPHFKLCVYDNASDDNTAEVVNSLVARDHRIRYHRHPENIGAQSNFIFGLSKADTPFVHLLSDDDFLLPGFLAHATTALQENPAAAFFSGGMISADAHGRARGFCRYGSEPARAYRSPELFRLLAPYTRTWTSALFRRAAVESLGGLKRETGYSFSIDLILRSAACFEAVLSDTPCAVFTIHSGSSSVAEASEAFESQLDLAFFNSINQAIDDALADNIVSVSEAHEMKTLLRSVTEQNFFRGACGLIARRRLPAAVQASQVLADHFNRNDLASVISIAARDDGLGSILRIALRGAQSARKVWFAGNRAMRYPAYSEIVRNRMAQLAA